MKVSTEFNTKEHYFNFNCGCRKSKEAAAKEAGPAEEHKADGGAPALAAAAAKSRFGCCKRNTTEVAAPSVPLRERLSGCLSKCSRSKATVAPETGDASSAASIPTGEKKSCFQRRPNISFARVGEAFRNCFRRIDCRKPAAATDTAAASTDVSAKKETRRLAAVRDACSGFFTNCLSRCKSKKVEKSAAGTEIKPVDAATTASATTSTSPAAPGGASEAQSSTAASPSAGFVKVGDPGDSKQPPVLQLTPAAGSTAASVSGAAAPAIAAAASAAGTSDAAKPAASFPWNWLGY